MELRNVPGRAYRKWRANGLGELAREGREFLVTDRFFRSVVYDRFLQDWITFVDRDALRSRPGTRRYDAFDGTIRYKGAPSFRTRDDPLRYEPGDRFVADVPDATILGAYGPGLTAAGNVVADTVGTPSLAQRRAGVGIARSMATNGPGRTVRALDGNATPDRRLGTVCFAVPPWNNYYHWTLECLARVRLLERYGADTGEYPTLLVPSDRPSWMDESLDVVDYSGAVEGFDDGIVGADRLVVPTFPDPIPVECRWLHDRMRRERHGTDGTERIYVSRGDATIRRVSNRNAIQRVLDEFDVNTYVLSDLSVREQIALFARAELVVGPHGAGLTNILYGDDLSVVELFGSKLLATFDRLAEFMGHEYVPLQCEQSGLDLHVDPDRLERTLERALE